ncbi:LLM class flavin-dependent oxidoreductase [Parahaliea maris]|uniref:LLM class flavin-dependent oxidoreductase n=1 Tax=Parahaliea maris TaxID=2716870 RepID=A0A5C9A076_9GAMM|nr:LLM class flavin-dependent oxidoreductase [Parahaliea maris]TXS94158.1 LLM class flavin-dependent oxidoreductase [Parahaliea maris]
MEFGVFSLGDHLPNPVTGSYNESQAEKHLGWVAEGVLAEKCGYSAIWLGEHHFNDYILAVPQMVLTAIAMKTERLRLGTAVTLLANHDPVRIAEDFATLDLLSEGRAEIGVAPGITPATFELFGQSAQDAGAMMVEKLDLLDRMWSEKKLQWEGNFRAPFKDAHIEPRTYSGRSIPIWMGTGTTIEKAVAAGSKGYKLQLATIFGSYGNYAPVAAAYREAYLAAGHPESEMEVAAIAYCYVDNDSADPHAAWAPYMGQYRSFMKEIVRGKGVTAGIQALASLATAQDLSGDWREFDLCGSPQQIAERIVQANRDVGGIDHLYCYFDAGGMPQSMVERSIEQFSRLVMPLVRDELGIEQAA